MPITATTAAIVTAVAAIGGLGLSAYSSIREGQEKQQAAKQQRQGYAAQAEMARRNQEVAEGNALATERAGAFAERQARLKAIRLGGTQAMGYAKAGVLPEGSPLDVMAETAALEEQDILATKYNYAMQAARYRSQGSFYGFEAERNDYTANLPTPDYALGGYLKAGTSLLTTGAGLASTWGGKTTYNPGKAGSGWGSI